MNRDSIIQSILKDKSFELYCRHLCKGNDNYKDLYQIVILKLLEIPSDRLITINEGNLKGYLNRLIYTSFVNKYSDFNKQTMSVGDDIQYDLAQVESEEDNHDKMFESIDNVLNEEKQYWESRNQPAWTIFLLQEYIKDNNYLEISRKTKIPYPTIRFNVLKIIKKINEDFNNNRQHTNRAKLS